ncbi:MAG: hypothetical protein AB7S26_13040 [Sandaracinaceae bacterium]
MNLRLFLPLLPLALSAPIVATAQDVPSTPRGPDGDARYAGHFVLEGTPEAARDRIRAELRPLIERLPALVQPLARERLNGRFRVAREIDVALPGDHIRVRYTGEETRTFDSRRGRPRRIETENGEATLTQLFRDGHLEQVFEGDNGRMYIVMELAGDGDRLEVTTILTGERLETPIRITHPYVRR